LGRLYYSIPLCTESLVVFLNSSCFRTAQAALGFRVLEGEIERLSIVARYPLCVLGCIVLYLVRCRRRSLHASHCR
jgi:hypothetical protein